MQELWKSILELLARIVTPDWGELIKLIPVALLGVVVLFFLITLRGFATAGPTRRAPARLTPIAPPDLHMPGPSYSPIFAALGAAALLWGLVVGGDALWIGLVILILGLLYWGREAVREYDRATHVETLPALVHAGLPPGVHLPGPSFRPLLGALGTAALLAGLVFGGWLLAAGLIIFVMTLVGWLPDARAEFDKTVEADRTGHLENAPPPGWPRRLLQVGIVLFAVAALFQAGLLPPRAVETAGGAAGSPAGSPAPSADAGPPATAFDITAKDISYDNRSIVVPADTPFSITFTNGDSPGVVHDIDIRAVDKQAVLQDQQVVNGGSSANYSYKGLPAGTYVFICSIHTVPNMTGTITVK
ncbi:MAG: cupredoxin domain-containing protein [Chloroflexi bacterium]|nr:cupredoxin domain-containing protein [Chloroflexota bacterium]